MATCLRRTIVSSVRFIPGQAWTACAVAPNIAVGRGGRADLFAHPQDIGRAIEYGLGRARDPDVLRLRPGEILGYLAYGHPFLEGNGRTLLAVHVDLCARAGFHVDWRKIGRGEFLEGLTRELEQPDPLSQPFAATSACGHTLVLGQNGDDPRNWRPSPFEH